MGLGGLLGEAADDDVLFAKPMETPAMRPGRRRENGEEIAEVKKRWGIRRENGRGNA